MKIELKVIAAAMFAVLIFGVSARAAEIEGTRHVSGEISWIDTKVGRLQLEADASPRTGEIQEYRITEHETRVQAPTDRKFLTIADLQPGQHVTIDVINGQEERIVQKITANLWPASDLRVAYGEIQSVDGAGTFTLAEKPGAGEEGEGHLSYFLFEPQNIVVMRSPSAQPVQLLLKPGDVVRVEFVVKDGKQKAQTITLYSPKVTSTTTTTTVTTTHEEAR